MINKIFLNPNELLLKSFADFLVKPVADGGRLKQINGVNSLTQLLVVLPTAQSGRNLRLELAKRFENKGILPPQIIQASQIIHLDDNINVASEMRLQAEFVQFVMSKDIAKEEWQTLFQEFKTTSDKEKFLGIYDQLVDIWGILSRNGLTMQDVLKSENAKNVLQNGDEDEQKRWENLASLEKMYFGWLNDRQLLHPSQVMANAIANPPQPPANITEVLLPAAIDPLPAIFPILKKWSDNGMQITVLLHAEESAANKFDEWGLPKEDEWLGDKRPDLNGKLSDADIFVAPVNAELALKIANDFPEAEQDKAIPELGLVDEELYPELCGAFTEKKFILSNPKNYLLATSTLGEIINSLIDIYPTLPVVKWKPGVALLRQWDVQKAFHIDVNVLKWLDDKYNELFPERFPGEKEIEYDGDFPVAAKGFLSCLRNNHDQRLSVFLRKMLFSIYKEHSIGDEAAERELAIAQEAAASFIDEIAELENAKVEPSIVLMASRRYFQKVSYQLQNDDDNLLKTAGWLELAWSDKEKIALAGMREGAVPENVVGHAFLPDSLRKSLGLLTNEKRLARDTCLLSELLSAREAGSVRAYFARADNQGNVNKPSRLLFLCNNDVLPGRTEHLFGKYATLRATPARGYNDDRWKPELTPDNITFQHLSPSALDSYIKCPFNFYLERCCGFQNKYEENKELGYDVIGTLIHEILQKYAVQQIARTNRGENQLSDKGEIRDCLANVCDVCFKKYKNSQPSLKFQEISIRKRIEEVAKTQAQWTSDGWLIKEAEYPIADCKIFDEYDITFKGRIDRIDYHPELGYRLIDYKTWDDEAKLDKSLFVNDSKQEMFADKVGYPTTILGSKHSKSRIVSVQLPLYKKMLETIGWNNVNQLCYLVLGKDRAFEWGTGTKEEEIFWHDYSPATIKRAVDLLLNKHLFWSGWFPQNDLKYGPLKLFMHENEKDIDDAWLANQTSILNGEPT